MCVVCESCGEECPKCEDLRLLAEEMPVLTPCLSCGEIVDGAPRCPKCGEEEKYVWQPCDCDEDEECEHCEFPF